MTRAFRLELHSPYSVFALLFAVRSTFDSFALCIDNELESDGTIQPSDFTLLFKSPTASASVDISLENSDSLIFLSEVNLEAVFSERSAP